MKYFLLLAMAMAGCSEKPIKYAQKEYDEKLIPMQKIKYADGSEKLFAAWRSTYVHISNGRTIVRGVIIYEN